MKIFLLLGTLTAAKLKLLSHAQNCKIPGHTGYFEVIHKTPKFLGVQCAGLALKSCIHTHGAKFLGIQYMSMKCSYYSLFLGIHIKEPQTKVSPQCKIMEGQEEDLSEDLELVALRQFKVLSTIFIDCPTFKMANLFFKTKTASHPTYKGYS